MRRDPDGRRRPYVRNKIIAYMSDFFRSDVLDLRDGHKQLAVPLGQALIRTAVDAINKFRTMEVLNQLGDGIGRKSGVADGDEAGTGTPARAQEIRQGSVSKK